MQWFSVLNLHIYTPHLHYYIKNQSFSQKTAEALVIQLLKNMAYTCAFGLNIWLLVGVFVPQTGGTETVSVMEGDSVTLHTGRTEILTDDHVLWIWLNSSDIFIAQIFKHDISFPDGNDIFRDRLQLDYKTGSLTITNITTTQSGQYQLIIASKVSKFFNVNVYGRDLSYLAVPVITSERPSSSSSSECVLMCSAVNVSHVTLSWYKGNSLFSSISVSDLNNSISLLLEIECLDDSYSCVLNNPISSQTKLFNNTDLCQPCPDHVHCCGFTEAVIRLVISAVVGVAAVAIVVYDITSRRGEEKQ